MNGPAHRGFFLFLLLALFLPSVHAVTSNATWVPGLESAYSIAISYSQCRATTGNSIITAAVTGAALGNTIYDANVWATIRRPDATTFDVNFTNDLSGTYTRTVTFDQNGTYLIRAYAYKTGASTGETSGYLYVHDLNWDVQFLNNGFDINIGGVGTIRNLVTNNDGNIVYDINANTTIYYPDGTVADANGTMSQLPNGEFVKNIFGPSPAGEYTVSSFFSCGALYDTNTEGTFTVLPTPTEGSSGGGGTGGTGGTGGSSGGSGGGGGGGGGGSVASAEIISIDFAPLLSRNAPSRMDVRVGNFTALLTDYLVQYTITNPNNEVTSGQKLVLAVPPHGASTVTLENAFTPTLIGNYTVHAFLRRPSGISLYDEYSALFPVAGTHYISVDVPTSSPGTALGLTFPFSINLANTGDFTEENVQVTWYLTDSAGNEYQRSTYSLTLPKGEAKDLTYAPYIPLNVPVGTHELTVEVTAYGVVQVKKTTFDVKSPNEYYAQLLTDLELRANQISTKIQSLAARGFNTRDVGAELLDIQTELARAKGMLLSGNFESLNTKLLDLSTRLTKLAAAVDALEQESPLLSREGLTLILYIGVAMLLGLFIWFLLWLRKNNRETQPTRLTTKPPSPVFRIGFLSKWLFLDKTYHPPEHREKLKQKPLISRLLGLGEEE